MVLPSVLFILTLFLEIVFTAFLAALSALSQDDIDALDEKTKAAGDKYAYYFCAAVFYVLLSNISFVGTVSYHMFNAGDHSLLIKLSVIVVCYILAELIFGFSLPYLHGSRFHLKDAAALSGLCRILMLPIYPLCAVSVILAGFAGRIFGLKKDDQEDNVTEDEILAIVNEGQESGAIEESEAKMINNIFELSDTEAIQIATPRSRIAAFDDSVKLKDALKDILNSSYSRYPVYHEDMDHITGILHIKDAVRLLETNPKRNPCLYEIKDSLLEPEFVPETKNIDDLFRDMQSSNTQMVIVTDEYGQTSGIIAMEDILEEIVGSIRDEYDREQELYTGDGESFETDGFTKLQDLSEELDIDFGETEFETINGFLTDRLGHIPSEGESFETVVGDYSFSIGGVSDKVIKTVMVKKNP